MKKIVLSILLLAGCLKVNAQKEGYNWTFGSGSGLTWNTTRTVGVNGLTPSAKATSLDGMPDAFPSAISTTEGCFSLSDSNGNLMFYSDGITIWNKNHVVMTNGSGLTGNNSSAQSGIIFPFPNNPNKFVAVTLGWTNANNLSYSVVDMAQSNNLGAVVSNQKNILFTGASGVTGESVTSILSPNGVDYWVIAPGRGDTSYLNAWLFTKNGPSAAPVVTNFPVGLTVSQTSSNGYLKITPNGKHFVWTTFDDRSAYVGDFNIDTGQFSNIRRVRYSSQAYGVEFSPDEKLVYIRTTNLLYVYNADEFFSLTDPSLAKNKTYNLSNTNNFVSALQLAPDG